jgi:hypothetical protein
MLLGAFPCVPAVAYMPGQRAFSAPSVVSQRY